VSPEASRMLRIMHAGSLAALVRDGLAPRLGRRHITVRAQPGFSVDLADALLARRAVADLFLSADAEVSRRLVGTGTDALARWFVVFARNALVLAYNPAGPFADQFVRAATGASAWYDVLLQPGVRLARDDPYRDPLGYYAVLSMDLAERTLGVSGLRHQLLGEDDNPAQVVPDPLGRLLRGEVDATFTYRSGAIRRGLQWIQLGAQVDLSEPALASTYAAARLVTPNDGEIRGRPIACSATAIEGSAQHAAAVHAIRGLVSPAGQLLVREHHLLPCTPLVGGDRAAVPRALTPYVGGDFPRPPRAHPASC
jgi:molybdate/tungstate transport system substrate-binding protein